MKIVNDDVTLRLVDDRRPLAGCVLPWAAISTAFGIYQVMSSKQKMTPHFILSLLLFCGVLAGFPFVLSFLFWVRRDFQFDKNSRVLTWERRSRIKTLKGTVPFSEIQDVAVEGVSVDTKHGGSLIEYQLVLHTTLGKLEITQSHPRSLASVQKQYEEPIARIRALVRDPQA